MKRSPVFASNFDWWNTSTSSAFVSRKIASRSVLFGSFGQSTILRGLSRLKE